MEPVEVIARIDAQGRQTPLSFTWQGQSISIASAGRRWQDERGEHILVMIPYEQVCELVYNQAEGSWYVRFFSAGAKTA